MKKLLFRIVLIGYILALCGCSNSKNHKEETKEQTEDNVITENSTTTEDNVITEDKDKDTETETSVSEASEENTDESAQNIDMSSLGLGYGETDKFRELYMMKHSVDDAENFVGTWKRTNIAAALNANIEIMNQNSEGFDFNGEFLYYSHNGVISGRAYFVGPNLAIFEYSENHSDEGDEQYIAFEKTDSGMNVVASNESGYLGLGMNVSVDGEYIIGEPVYTNTNILKDTFSDDELTQLQELLGDCYDDYFKFVVEYGILESRESTLENGTKCVYYEGFIPTMGGYGFKLLIGENGDLYYLSEGENAGYRTNVSEATDFPVFE